MWEADRLAGGLFNINIIIIYCVYYICSKIVIFCHILPITAV